MRRATSCPASATPATASSGRASPTSTIGPATESDERAPSLAVTRRVDPVRRRVNTSLPRAPSPGTTDRTSDLIRDAATGQPAPALGDRRGRGPSRAATSKARAARSSSPFADVLLDEVESVCLLYTSDAADE